MLSREREKIITFQSQKLVPQKFKTKKFSTTKKLCLLALTGKYYLCVKDMQDSVRKSQHEENNTRRQKTRPD